MVRVVAYAFVVSALLCAGLAACGAKPPAKTVQADGYLLAVTTQPSPPEVGMTAELEARLSKDGKSQEDCRLRFRQIMRDMGMDTDRLWHDMGVNGASGAYRGRSAEFGMGGDWNLEFQFTCGGVTHTASIPLHLEWPK